MRILFFLLMFPFLSFGQSHQYLDSRQYLDLFLSKDQLPYKLQTIKDFDLIGKVKRVEMDWGYMNFDLKGNLVSIQNTDSILPYSAKFNDNGSVKEVKFEYKDSYSSRNYNEYLLLTYNKDGDIINQTLGTEFEGRCFKTVYQYNNKSKLLKKNNMLLGFDEDTISMDEIYNYNKKDLISINRVFYRSNRNKSLKMNDNIERFEYYKNGALKKSQIIFNEILGDGSDTITKYYNQNEDLIIKYEGDSSIQFKLEKFFFNNDYLIVGTFYKSNYDVAFSDSENYEYIFDIKGNWIEKKITRVIVKHKYDNQYELDFNNAKTAIEIKKRKIVYYKN